MQLRSEQLDLVGNLLRFYDSIDGIVLVDSDMEALWKEARSDRSKGFQPVKLQALFTYRPNCQNRIASRTRT